MLLTLGDQQQQEWRRTPSWAPITADDCARVARNRSCAVAPYRGIHRRPPIRECRCRGRLVWIEGSVVFDFLWLARRTYEFIRPFIGHVRCTLVDIGRGACVDHVREGCAAAGPPVSPARRTMTTRRWECPVLVEAALVAALAPVALWRSAERAPAAPAVRPDGWHNEHGQQQHRVGRADPSQYRRRTANRWCGRDQREIHNRWDHNNVGPENGNPTPSGTTRGPTSIFITQRT